MSLISFEMPPTFKTIPVVITLNVGPGDAKVETFREARGTLILFGVWVGISSELGCGCFLHPLFPMHGYESGAGRWLPMEEGSKRLLRLSMTDRDEDGIDFVLSDHGTRVAWGSIMDAFIHFVRLVLSGECLEAEEALLSELT